MPELEPTPQVEPTVINPQNPPVPDPAPFTEAMVPESQYKGLQKTVQKLAEQIKALTDAQTMSVVELTAARTEAAKIPVLEQTFQDQIAALTSQKTAAEAKNAQYMSDMAKITMVKQEFPALIRFTELVPNAEEDVMRAAFTELDKHLRDEAGQRAQALMLGSTPPVGGQRGKEPVVTLDTLWETMESSDPNGPEYTRAANLYAQKRFKEQKGGSLPTSSQGTPTI